MHDRGATAAHRGLSAHDVYPQPSLVLITRESTIRVRWQQREHVMSTSTTQRVVALLLPVLDDIGVEGWMNRPRRQYGDRTPRQLLAQGRDVEVLRLAMALVGSV